MSQRARRHELLDLYERRRVQEQLAYHEHRRKVAQRGRRQLMDVSTLLYTATAFIGAMAASPFGSRTMWAVLAAACGAGASALTGYAMMAGFERNEEQSKQMLAALAMLDAIRPEPFMVDGPDGGTIVTTYVQQVEGLFQKEVQSWTQSAESDEQQEQADEDAAFAAATQQAGGVQAAPEPSAEAEPEDTAEGAPESSDAVTAEADTSSVVDGDEASVDQLSVDAPSAEPPDASSSTSESVNDDATPLAS